MPKTSRITGIRVSASANFVQRPFLIPFWSALPAAMPDGEVAVLDVLADQATGYERRSEVFSGSLGRAGAVGLWLAVEGTTVVVGRLPGRAAYPRPRGFARLFTWMDAGHR